MSITVTRSSSVLVGTSFNGLSPATTNMANITSATTTNSTALVMGSGTSTNIIEANIMAAVYMGNTTTVLTIGLMIANDNGGTPNYVQSGPAITVPAVVGYYNYEFDPPDSCQNVLLQFITTGTVSAYIFAEASTLSVS